MEDFILNVKSRSDFGSSASRRYRREGQIPSVVYSHGEKPLSILLEEREFVRIAKAAKSSQIFSLKCSDMGLDGQSAIVKEIQMDYVKGNVVHVDLQAIRADEVISVRVGLKFVGEAPGVKLDGGILTVLAHEVVVSCLPSLIPQELEVDVSSLHIGDSVHLRDLKVPEGVKFEGNLEETLVSVTTIHVPTVEETTAVAVEGAEGAEGAAAAPAEGGAEAGAKAGAPGEGEKAEKKGKEK